MALTNFKFAAVVYYNSVGGVVADNSDGMPNDSDATSSIADGTDDNIDDGMTARG